jgi:hypothetical protein
MDLKKFSCWIIFNCDMLSFVSLCVLELKKIMFLLHVGNRHRFFLRILLIFVNTFRVFGDNLCNAKNPKYAVFSIYS